MKLNQKVYEIIERTLKIESFSYSRTLLQPFHTPDYFVIREIFGVNQFINGNCMYEVKGVKPQHVQEGAAVILPLTLPHKMKNLNPGSTVSAWHNIRCSIMDTIDPLSFLETPFVLPVKIGGKIGDINRRLLENEDIKETNFLEYIIRKHSLGMQLIEIILQISVLKPDTFELILKTERIEPVLKYIQKNLTKKISTQELANVLSISEPRFYEIFRDSTGISPGKYIQQQRMKRAHELLIEPGIKIYEVAEKSGYDDPFHFSRLFKNNFGVSPERFRRQFAPPHKFSG